MCLDGKKEAKEKPGNYKCKNCGAVSTKKADICQPKKIKKKADKKDKKSKKKGKPKGKR